MGGLGHYLEADGIPTTQVSLIREHTETINPPRALWVPFELGRPLGTPDQPDFQRRVLAATLALFAANAGPALADFPDDAPETGIIEGWACPINLAPPPSDETDIGVRLTQELEQLRPWHDLWLENRGRTTVGASDLDIDIAANFMATFLDQTEPDNPRPELDVVELMKLVVEDVKAFYLEAAMAQPRESNSQAVADWFWGETVAGGIMLDLHPILLEHPEKGLRFLARALLVPRLQQYRLGEGERPAH